MKFWLLEPNQMQSPLFFNSASIYAWLGSEPGDEQMNITISSALLYSSKGPSLDNKLCDHFIYNMFFVFISPHFFVFKLIDVQK